MFPDLIDPRALRLPIDQFVGELVANYSSVLRAMTQPLLDMLVFMETMLRSSPWWVVVLVVFGLAWLASRRVLFAAAMALMLFAIGLIGLWDAAMQTLALMVVAVFLSVLIGIPLGLLMASFNWLRRIMLPVLDVMQTMPSFVYLIPVLMLFGLGKVPAVLATVVYAVPPLIRLTSLGLRQVDPNVMEAAQAYGVTRWQMLVKVTLPLARPSIMAGINQTTMMALSMVVVASMIGAQGLGEDVLAGIQTLDIGRGLQAGAAIVILAIVMDRISQSYGRSQRRRRRDRKQP